MKLLELITVSAIAGALGAIAFPYLSKLTEKPQFSQAQISIGNSLRYGGCPEDVNGWVFRCYKNQIAGSKQDLEMVGAKSNGQILFCKGVSGLKTEDLESMACPDLASVR